MKSYTIDENGIKLFEKRQVSTAFTSKAQEGLMQIEDNSWWFSTGHFLLRQLPKSIWTNQNVYMILEGETGIPPRK